MGCYRFLCCDSLRSSQVYQYSRPVCCANYFKHFLHSHWKHASSISNSLSTLMPLFLPESVLFLDAMKYHCRSIGFWTGTLFLSSFLFFVLSLSLLFSSWLFVSFYNSSQFPYPRLSSSRISASWSDEIRMSGLLNGHLAVSLVR